MKRSTHHLRKIQMNLKWIRIAHCLQLLLSPSRLSEVSIDCDENDKLHSFHSRRSLLVRCPPSMYLKYVMLYYIYASYAWLSIKSRQTKETKLSVKAHKVSNNNSNHALEQITRGEAFDDLRFGLVPAIPMYGLSYYYGSSFIHLYIFASSLLFYDRILDETGRYYYFSCMLPRPMVTPLLNQKTTMILISIMSAWHLIWRALMFLFSDGLIFDSIRFLLADEEILEKVRIATEFGPEFVDNFEEILASGQFEILRDCLFFRSKDFKKRETFLLRPNRTMDWHKKVHASIKKAAIFSCSSLLSFGVILACDGLRVLFFRQQMIYRGCDTDQWNFIFLLRIALTTVIGLVQIVDTFSATMFVTFVGFEMIYDMQVYWDHLKQELDGFSQLMPQIKAIRDSYSVPTLRPWKSQRLYQSVGSSESDQVRETSYLPTAGGRLSDKTRDRIAACRKREVMKLDSSLDEKLDQVRAGLVDFFHQLHRADLFVNILITFVFFIWLSANIVLTMAGLQTDITITSTNKLIRSLQIFGLLLVTSVCWPILNMRRSVESGYLILCTLIAYDQNLVFNRWSELTPFYTDRPHYSFTFFDKEIFSRLSFLKILSFTVTCVFVLESLQLKAGRINLHDSGTFRPAT